MISFNAKREDAIWMEMILRKELGKSVSVKTHPLFKELTWGYFYGHGDPVPFIIKSSAGEFIRITATGDNIYSVKKEALNAIAETLIPLTDRSGALIGHPIASFDLFDGEDVDPYYEWAMTEREEYTRELIDGSLFEDAKPQNMTVYDENGTMIYGSQIEF